MGFLCFEFLRLFDGFEDLGEVEILEIFCFDGGLLEQQNQG